MKCDFKQRILAVTKQYREQISYLFFGVLTTVVNYVVFALLRLWIGDFFIHVINIITFIVATLFAYVTNKFFVFQSRNWNFRALLKELTSFFAARISSFCVEAVGLYVCVDLFHVGKYSFYLLDGTMVAKIVLSFVAVVLNYFFSKFCVFNKKREEGQK